MGADGSATPAVPEAARPETAAQDRRELVQEYYGKTLQTSADLKTSACCPTDAMPRYLQALLAHVHEEVQARFYGCGSPIPPLLEGCTVVDLGCGAGRDSYLLAQLVGPDGRVIGIDMTDSQLQVANHYVAWHMDRFGYATPNVRFVKGLIEDLAAAGIADDSVDVVVSNCVINLSADKRAVFSEIFRVLKPGGELYFADIFAGRRLPESLAKDPVLVGECLGGALYLEDFRRLLAELGCADYRVVNARPVTIEDPELAERLGPIPFFSMTIRAFKLPLEDRCEDYGQVARYHGSIPHHPHAFMLDDHHLFETGRAVPVCGNTAAMLAETRYAPHFTVIGDRSRHYGLFPCREADRSPSADEAPGGCC
ncbi:MAG: methyltransferase domain-containing protein [Alphaproteobacteria bacterium]|nr:MAG: methyltransferase domain-containing protein [Alphaproteobacteria bacterium]